MIQEPPDSSLPARLREFHERLPLAGSPPNALLSLPDDRLLYLVAVLRDTPVPAPALSVEEWQEFLDHLKPHGVYPLMAYRLRKWPAECRPPGWVIDWLNRVFLYAAARSMRAGRQIQVVVDAFEAAGIPSVLLKGPALAWTVYPDPALRQSSDIDILVRPANVLVAENILESLGYACEQKFFHISEEAAHHETFQAPDRELPIELHWSLDNVWNLFPNGYLDEVLARRILFRSKDLSYPTLDNADHLLFLIFHDVFQHNFVRLDWAFDLSLMISKMSPTEEQMALIHLAVEHCIRVPLELAVTVSDLWFASYIPEKLRDFTAWPSPTGSELRLRRHAVQRQTSVLSTLYLIIQGQHGAIDKIRAGIRFIIPPQRMMKEFRRSTSPFDGTLAHLRRWMRIFQ